MPVVNHRPDGSRNQDEAYKELFLSRAPPKRRKSGGLDARLGRMLHHLNTSLVGDPSQLPGRRPRNPSSCSSSSTIVPETAQALIESIHNTVKSDNVGENFAVIKPCRSPNKTHTGFFTNNNLPSWKNSDNKSRKDEIQELPDWLSHTFATLDAGNPLRSLALSKEADPVHYREVLATTQESLTPASMPLQYESNDAIFTFTPPPQTTPDIDRGHTSYSPSESLSRVITTEKTHLLAMPYGPNLRDNLSLDELPYGDADKKTQEFTPFTEPGPFAQKAVHFLTPVRSSIVTPGTPPTQFFSDSYDTNQQERDLFLCNAFSTPGPAASFTLPSFEYGASSLASPGNDFSDPFSFAAESRTKDAIIASVPSNKERHASALSFENLQEKPFSHRGLSFSADPLKSLESPPGISPMSRFIAMEHDRLAMHNTSPGSSLFNEEALPVQSRDVGLGLQPSLDVSAAVGTISESNAVENPVDPRATPTTYFAQSVSHNNKKAPSLPSASAVTGLRGAFGSRDASNEAPFSFIPVPNEDPEGECFIAKPPTSWYPAQEWQADASPQSLDHKFHTHASEAAKPRTPLAPARSVYLSSISRSYRAKSTNIKTNTLKKSKAEENFADEVIWNINSSQLSGDSIEEWEA